MNLIKLNILFLLVSSIGFSQQTITNNQYYFYVLKKTPLELILDKNYLISQIKNLKGRIIENKYLNFNYDFLNSLSMCSLASSRDFMGGRNGCNFVCSW